MGKKVNALSYLYLIGMALAVIGFCCPMFKGIFGSSANGFKFINFEKGGFATIGAVLIFAGAVLGLVYAVLPMINVKLPSVDLVKWIAVIALVVGVVVLIVGFTQSKFYSAVAKQLLKHAMYGFYMLAAGIVLAILGKVMAK